MPKRRQLIGLLIGILVLLLVVLILSHKTTSYQKTLNVNNSPNQLNAESRLYTYPALVNITLASVHSAYRPTSKINFVLSTAPLTFVPDSSNTGRGKFIPKPNSSSLPVVGVLISSKTQIKNDIYVYRVPIPGSWRSLKNSELYLLANYGLVPADGPDKVIGYSTTYQVIVPTS